MSIQGPSPLQPLVLPALPPAANRAGARDAAPSSSAPGESTLWSLLTDEEREFFAQQAGLGALTYGRGATPAAATNAPAAPLGQRIDVKG